MKVNLDKVQDDLFEVLGDTSTWCEDQYSKIFSKYFEGVMELYEKVSSDGSKLSDDELEWILTSLPLKMIAVSEQLSQYRLNNECLKLYIKKIESDAIKDSEAKTMSAKRDEASQIVMEYKILSSAYSSISSRVENEINFSREFIMTAKKIWDSRAKVYEGSPVSTTDLDSYTPSN